MTTALPSDMRMTVRFGRISDAGPGCALLIEGEAVAPTGVAVARFVLSASPHGLACACCAPRAPVAIALSRLFLARARGEVADFACVVAVAATPSGAQAIRDALTSDVLATARFRLVG